MAQTMPGLQYGLGFNLLAKVGAGVDNDPVFIIARNGD
jgi:hypothetical protein